MVVAYDETVWSIMRVTSGRPGPGTASLVEIVNEGLSRLVHKL